MIKGAGLHPVERGSSRCDYYYRDVESCLRGQSSAGPAQAVMRAVGKEKLRSVVVDALRSHTDSHGAVLLRNVFNWACGERR